MKNILSILLLIILSAFKVEAQDSLCFENSSGAWWPIEPGLKLKYSEGKESKTSVILKDSVKFKGNFYFIEKETYKNGEEKEFYYREKNGAVYSFNLEDSLESKALPASPEVGQKWTSADNEWSYKIISLTSSFSTPFCNFNDLLEVETRSSNREGVNYTLFYKRGVGFVGLNVNNKPYTFILPNKKIDERTFIAYGCEKFESEEAIKSCTQEIIFNHIQDNLKYSRKFKKGKIYVNITIGTDGDVEEAEVIKAMPNSEKQQNEVLRVIKSLPTFIPAQVDDNNPIRVSFVIPINF